MKRERKPHADAGRERELSQQGAWPVQRPVGRQEVRVREERKGGWKEEDREQSDRR